MSLIAQGDLQNLIDSMAQQVIEALAKFDNDGSLANSMTLGAKNNQDRCVALGDAEQEADLIQSAINAFNYSKAYPLLYDRSKTLINALNVHIRKYNLEGINGYLGSAGFRAAPEFTDIHLASVGTYLTPANVWPPLSPTNDAPYGMAKFVGSGPGAGTFNAGNVIDSTKYGGGNLVIENTGVGALSGTVDFDIDLVKADGTTETKNVVADSLAIGATLPIGTPGTDQYVEVTDIRMNNGAANDTITVKTTADRDISGSL